MYSVLELVGAGQVARVLDLRPGAVGAGTRSRDGTTHREHRERVEFFDDFRSSPFFFIDGPELVMAESLPAILDAFHSRGRDTTPDEELLLAYADTGLIIPPFTVYRDIFQIPALSELRISGHRTELNYVGLESRNAVPFSRTEDVFVELKAALSRGLDSLPEAPVTCTVSGGVDSAVLLATLCDTVEPSRITALTCRMPGFDQEVLRAAEVCNQCGVESRLFSASEADATPIVDEFTARFCNLVFDPVVPVLTLMIREHVQADPARRLSHILVEGQGADTVLAGLPHNTAISLYRGALWPFFRAVAAFLPKSESVWRRRFRGAYRLAKVVGMLAQRTWSRALLRALDMNGARYNRYFVRLESMLDSMQRATRDNHKAVMLFFLHILQGREMQKYQLTPPNTVVLLPFMDLEFMRRCFKTPTRFFLRKGRRKIPINDRARSLFDGLFSRETTTPFAVEYKVRGTGSATEDDLLGTDTYGLLKIYSQRALRLELSRRGWSGRSGEPSAKPHDSPSNAFR